MEIFRSQQGHRWMDVRSEDDGCNWCQDTERSDNPNPWCW